MINLRSAHNAAVINLRAPCVQPASVSGSVQQAHRLPNQAIGFICTSTPRPEPVILRPGSVEIRLQRFTRYLPQLTRKSRPIYVLGSLAVLHNAPREKISPAVSSRVRVARGNKSQQQSNQSRPTSGVPGKGVRSSDTSAQKQPAIRPSKTSIERSRLQQSIDPDSDTHPPRRLHSP